MSEYKYLVCERERTHAVDFRCHPRVSWGQPRQHLHVPSLRGARRGPAGSARVTATPRTPASPAQLLGRDSEALLPDPVFVV
ncbi:hypothetical protein MATL_G00168890 [Megalops atlanticus]|uniref:Uncharacterized protein n=1 Tax=Megalops atlanticus TaxID=7932 RepID=A0A9D3T176_MEGAT|nr:hypothetical protein MATL_G00168890 [Megalops atlanticus]